MARHRVLDVQKYQATYEKYDCDWDMCYYCGEQQEVTDHVPPLVAATLSLDRWLIPSCKECNLILGTQVYYSLSERVEYLRARYPIRYKKLLNTPDWEPEELEEMGYNLRVSIDHHISKKKSILRKIEWLTNFHNLL
jgi:hypothetical protein